MTEIKADQKILNKYFDGSYDTTLQTPLKNVRAYLKGDKALFISTNKVKGKVSSFIALVAAQKGWNLSMNTEGSYLVCLLYP